MMIKTAHFIVALLFSATLVAQQREDDPLLQSSLWVRATEYQDTHAAPEDRYKASVVMKYMITMFNQTPDMPSSELTKQYDFAVAALDGTLFPSTDATIEKARTYGKDLEGRVPIKAFVDLAADMATDLNHAYNADTGRQFQYDLYRASLDSEQTFVDAYRLAVKYPDTFGLLLNRDMSARLLKVPTDASIDTIKQAYPSLNVPRNSGRRLYPQSFSGPTRWRNRRYLMLSTHALQNGFCSSLHRNPVATAYA
jgi:hypothetical protein